MIRGLKKPEITDSDSWWTGRHRIMTFASWRDALDYWEIGEQIPTIFTLDDMKRAFDDGRKYEAGELELPLRDNQTAFNAYLSYRNFNAYKSYKNETNKKE